MNRPFQRLPLLPVLLLLLLPAFGCGGGEETTQQPSGAPAQGAAGGPSEAPPDQGQGGGKHGGKGGAKGHVTLAGASSFDGDATMSCGAFSGKGLEITLAPAQAPQVQVRIADFAGAGEYPATIVVSEHPENGAAHEWNGSGKVQVQSREGGRRKRTALSGTFNGNYQGEGGQQGTVSGSFRRCVLKETAP
jgi:hypothetical protein